MHTGEPRGKRVNTCQLCSHLGNSSILALAGALVVRVAILKATVVYVYSQPDKYIYHANLETHNHFVA